MTKKREFLLIVLIVLFSTAIILSRIYNLEADPDTSLTWSQVFYTDEGWKCGNALNLYQRGEWLIEEGKNDGLVLPVMPVIQYGFFKILGLSLFSARLPVVLFSLLAIALLGYFVTRDLPRNKILPTLFLLLFLAGTNYYFYSYSRLGLLEVPMFGVGLLCFLCSYLAMTRGNSSESWGLYLAAGLLLSVSYLTKYLGAIFALALVFSLIVQIIFCRET